MHVAICTVEVVPREHERCGWEEAVCIGGEDLEWFLCTLQNLHYICWFV